MTDLQKDIAATLHVRPRIAPEAELRRRIDFLKSYLATTQLSGYVLGISGGQDSTLAGFLAQRAVEEIRAGGGSARFIALRLPYTAQGDEQDAQLARKFIDPDETLTLDIAPATDALVAQLTSQGVEITDFNKGNIKARQRMVAHYAIAGAWRLAVLGSDHAAESLTGFFTKYGDGAADVMPLAGLTKGQGRELLIAAGSPPALYEKIPTADLLDDAPAQSDEAALGVSYAEIDDYLEGRAVSEVAASAIERHYRGSEHKRRLPARPHDTWWRE